MRRFYRIKFGSIFNAVKFASEFWPQEFPPLLTNIFAVLPATIASSFYRALMIFYDFILKIWNN